MPSAGPSSTEGGVSGARFSRSTVVCIVAVPSVSRNTPTEIERRTSAPVRGAPFVFHTTPTGLSRWTNLPVAPTRLEQALHGGVRRVDHEVTARHGLGHRRAERLGGGAPREHGVHDVAAEHRLLELGRSGGRAAEDVAVQRGPGVRPRQRGRPRGARDIADHPQQILQALRVHHDHAVERSLARRLRGRQHVRGVAGEIGGGGGLRDGAVGGGQGVQPQDAPVRRQDPDRAHLAARAVGLREAPDRHQVPVLVAAAQERREQVEEVVGVHGEGGAALEDVEALLVAAGHGTDQARAVDRLELAEGVVQQQRDLVDRRGRGADRRRGRRGRGCAPPAVRTSPSRAGRRPGP